MARQKEPYPSPDDRTTDPGTVADPLSRLTHAALSHGDVKARLSEVLARIRDEFAADTAVLLLADEAGTVLTVAAAVGLLQPERAQDLRIPIGAGIAGRIAAERRPMSLDTLAGQQIYIPVLHEGVCSLLGVPLVVGSRLIGVLHVGNRNMRRFTGREERRLQGIADRIALVLDHAHLYAAERGARDEAVRAERRFRDLVHNLDAIVWEADLPDWRFTFVSRQAEKVLGYPVQRWLDTPDFWAKIVHPDDRAEVVRLRQQAVEQGTAASLEYRVRAADGRTLWIFGLFEGVLDAVDSPRQVRGLMLDITQRRRAEEDAMRLAAIVEGSEDAIIGKDLAGIITSWNAGAEQMYGYTAQEAVGQHISLLTPGHRREEVDEIMRTLLRGGRISHLDTRRQRRDGEMIDVALTISPIRDATGNRIVGASTIAREVTALKRAERTLRTTEKLAATGRLAASIAHEINNPMASVTNLLYLLQHHSSLDATAAEYVNLAQEELQRVTHIVRQMLGFYRESEAPVSVNLREVIENVLVLYARRLQNARIKVETRFRADAFIRGFPGEIRQVFSNLIVNSIEAVGENGRLCIDARRSRDWSNPAVTGVRVTIADNGPGIPDSARRHICEPFFTTKGERGTGLGLWVSDGIVRKHGGAMRIRSSTSERRHGTVFSVFFPVEPVALNRAA